MEIIVHIIPKYNKKIENRVLIERENYILSYIEKYMKYLYLLLPDEYLEFTEIKSSYIGIQIIEEISLKNNWITDKQHLNIIQ